MNTKQETTPLVTIITITRNLIRGKRENFAKECIESVHKQNYPNIEHIIIDGASDDGTLSFLQKYVDQKYITVYSEPDNGIYDAMNKGLHLAKGKYINFLNTDDFFHNPSAIKLSISQLEKYSADYSFANAILKYENGKDVVWEGDISCLAWASHYCHQTMFIRTELLKSIGGFNTNYKISADTEMMIHLYAMKINYIKINDDIVTYRVGGFSSQYQHQSRIDHSTAFYNYIGQHIGLSLNDCFQLWNKSFLKELQINKQIELICKVPREYGQQHLIKDIIKHTQELNKKSYSKKYYLLSIFPFLKKKYYKNKIKYYLFNFLPILKITKIQ